jgi:ABC-type phosphate transport system substrate-binding protein
MVDVNQEITYLPVFVPLWGDMPHREAMPVGHQAEVCALISFAGGAEMRLFPKLIAAGAIAASAIALTVAPAMADPPKGVAPKSTDIVGVGSNTIQNLMDQLSVDYNKAFPKGSKLYSWDALNPKTGLDDNIATKKHCSPIVRPNGSGAGLAALILNAKVGGHFCIDFSRSSSPRSASAPPKAKGGVVFVALAKDAVTYATNAGSNAPNNLTAADLAKIYNCTATTWNQVGGKSHATIDAQLPQTSSGTRKFFLAEIGVTAPGSCVNSAKGENINNYPEENEGTNAFLKGANVIYPYSAGAYIAAVFHSSGKDKNLFGTNDHGKMLLRDLNGKAPTVGKGAKTTINPKFTPDFIRTLYDVVRWANTRDNIPNYLEPLFASAHAKVKGWICSSKTAQAAILDYGFLNTPFCGAGS